MTDDKPGSSGIGTDVTLRQINGTAPLLQEGATAGAFAYAVGDLVGERYRIVRLLGEGGMGEVYEAEDLLLGERVALKTLRPALARNEATILRFQREILLARKITHRNVCRLFDVGLDWRQDRAGFITMELLEGETLSARLARAGRLSTREALPIAEQLVAALAAAHAAGVIHRDLKSSNVMLVQAPQAPRVVVTDMGMARAAAEDGDQITGDAIVGSPAYMAPEQVEGRRLTPACDIYALGVVLYEMVTGVLPFAAETALATAAMRLCVPPPSPRSVVPDLDPRWERAILACLARDPEARPPEAQAVSRLLRPMSASTLRRRVLLVVAAAACLALALLAVRLWRSAARERWVRQTAIPEVERLVAAEEYAPAAALAREALAVAPGDVVLEKLWTQATQEFSIDSTPPGADILFRPYRSASRSWTHLGKTPLSRVHLPRDFYVWQLAAPGVLTGWRIAPTWIRYLRTPVQLMFHLVPQRSAPPGMVPVGVADTLFGEIESPVPLGDFFIDPHEVTNAEYKRFVDAGGYRRPELWKQPFLHDGQVVSWEQAMAAFRDATGRPGPSTWELGTFAAGHESHPVAGVSWYEAAAYAVFAGKTLPTVHHWRWAAQLSSSMLVIPGSNFDAAGSVPVGGAGSLSGFGTHDMAGNVKEWCLNESDHGKRYVLGGGFGEPSYMFLDLDAQTPWLRAANIGFRCVVLSRPPAPEAVRPIETARPRDPRAEQPASDEVFRAYRRLFAYDRTGLDARIEFTEETADWRHERVSFDAAYGGERVIAHLYLPTAAQPPFQTVLLFPGANALLQDRFELSQYGEFVPRTGRALLQPIFKSTYERRDALRYDTPEPTAFWRDHMVAWSKELGRSLDYLETRSEIDRDRFAYLGISWGGNVAPVLLAVEPRFRTAVLWGGALSLEKTLPEVDPVNFVGRVHIPVLMVNGRYDHMYPLETSQKWLFELLGTPADRKKHNVYDSGHAPPLREFVRDSLDWLDTTLGPVRR